MVRELGYCQAGISAAGGRSALTVSMARMALPELDRDSVCDVGQAAAEL